MGKKFAEYSQFDLSKVNAEVLKKWDENQVFAKSMTEREGCPSFVFYEGPPSANAGHSPRNGSLHQRYFLPLQNHERFPGET